MQFNSLVFWCFFALVLGLYRVLGHRWQNRLLLFASYVFYGYWDWRFLSLIFVSTLIDYIVGQSLAYQREPARRRLLLTLSVVANLSFLGFFKYYDFFARELNAVLTAIGFNDALPILHVVLPVGISFYTFQSMSYTIDIYREKTKPTTRFEDFALYVSFFPQLVAGPIERSGHLLGQITVPRVLTSSATYEGLYLVIFGLFKKVVVADNCAAIANHVFSLPPEQLTTMDVLIGVYAFAFQIYGDFSAYSSIAQGLSRMMGFSLMWNFRVPYLARDPSDFWRRWHVSLSSWLRDYLYIPLGGNRGVPWMTYRNLLLTMLLGGLWHGAAWTFVLWGALHGLLLIGYRLAGVSSAVTEPETGRRLEGLPDSLGEWVKVLVMFHFVCLTWLLFRADSMTQVAAMLQAMVAGRLSSSFSLYGLTYLAIFAGPVILYESWLEHRRDQLAILLYPAWFVGAILGGMLVMVALLAPPAAQTFIYFQF